MFTDDALRTAAQRAHDSPVATVSRLDPGRNHTARIRFADGHEVVLKAGTRFPSAFPAEPATMRVVARETSVPVPAVHATGREPLGYPYAVYEYVPDAGVDWPRQLPVDSAIQLCWEAGRNLAALHRLRFRRFGRVGVTDDGGLAVVDAHDYRQTLRQSLSRQLDLVDGSAVGDRRDAIQRQGEDLITAIDPGEVQPALVHGDYRVDNLRLTPGHDRLTDAVLDWELPTAGDPLWDVAMTLTVLTTNYGIPSAARARMRRAFYAGYGLQPTGSPRWRCYELLGRLRLARHPATEVGDRGPTAVAERIRQHRTAIARLLEGGSLLR